MIAKEDIYNTALTLNPVDKIKLVDELLQSLDLSDKAIQKAWADVADSRLNAYKKGEIESVSMDAVFAKYKD